MICALFEVAMMPRYVERAERMRAAMPLRYRVDGHEHWLESRVLDISDSGVLFGPAAGSPEPGTRVEMMFSSQTPIGSMPPGQMMCAAEIIRKTEQGQVGARFSQCRFVLDDVPVMAAARAPAMK
jgi:PilZ domain-containing protein